MNLSSYRWRLLQFLSLMFLEVTYIGSFNKWWMIDNQTRLYRLLIDFSDGIQLFFRFTLLRTSRLQVDIAGLSLLLNVELIMQILLPLQKHRALHIGKLFRSRLMSLYIKVGKRNSTRSYSMLASVSSHIIDEWVVFRMQLVAHQFTQLACVVLMFWNIHYPSLVIVKHTDVNSVSNSVLFCCRLLLIFWRIHVIQVI